MEAFTLKLLKDAIDNNKDAIDMLRGEIQTLKGENCQMEKENVTLKEQINTLQGKETEEEEDVEDIKPSMDSSFDDAVAALNIMTMEAFTLKLLKDAIDNNKDAIDMLRGEIQTLKEENCQMEKENVTLKEQINSLQGKETEEEEDVEDIKPSMDSSFDDAVAALNIKVPNPLLSSGGQHPSQRAVSGKDAIERLMKRKEQEKIRQEAIDRREFCVQFDEQPIEKDLTLWIGGCIEVEKPCDFMDPESGVYSVPAQGEYEFGLRRFGSDSGDENFKIYLCRDRDNKQEMISHQQVGASSFASYFNDTVRWQCEPNDKVWLEAVGLNGDHSMNTITFTGKYVDGKSE